MYTKIFVRSSRVLDSHGHRDDLDNGMSSPVEAHHKCKSGMKRQTWKPQVRTELQSGHAKVMGLTMKPAMSDANRICGHTCFIGAQNAGRSILKSVQNDSELHSEQLNTS